MSTETHRPETDVQIRDYQDVVEPSWLRCRALSFLGSSYFDDVKAQRTRFDGPAIELVAVRARPEGLRTPGDHEVVGILDVEIDTEEGLATIDTVAVHPDHERSGIAEALLAEALVRLTPRGSVTRLDAWTREDEAANRWYARQGMQVDVEQEYLHVHTEWEEAEGFVTPDGLSSRPVRGFFHAELADETDLRSRYARVHRCRRYLRDLD